MYSVDNDDVFLINKKEFVDLGKISEPLSSKQTLFTLPSINKALF